MSDSDESAVLVEHMDAPPELTDETDEAARLSGKDEITCEKLGDAGAAQIVSIGNDDDEHAFTFHKDRWNEILSRIPVGWKVAVVSVVGAFRTGKSFLLSLFLRYLYALEREQKAKAISKEDEEPTKESEKRWYEQFESLGKEGFDWKAGSERNTTGIWMWSHPFFLERGRDEPLAVLVVDTQGMFDHETTMALTASIFGLSTLLSSYQIYNVDKRIQEDNLQQLALFTEYARTAMGQTEQERKPFQKIEFLVRDWQHFEDEDEDYEAMEKSMKEYLDNVLSERKASDLKDTREQILTCFEDISCYGLCHPGFAVTKKKYSGDVSVLEEMFVELLDRYCQQVFSPEALQPKQIHDRELTAVELGSYIQAYAELFVSGANFPTAATLLAATASANNSNAITLALAEYNDRMDRVAGPKCSNFIRPEELNEEHKLCHGKAVQVFRSVATFGSKKSIEEAEAKLNSQLESSWLVYESLNNGRNPLLGFETWLLPMAMAFLAYILRWFTDMTCSPYSQVCKASSEVLSHAYAVVFCFLAILAATKLKQIQELWQRFYAALEILLDEKTENTKHDKD